MCMYSFFLSDLKTKEWMKAETDCDKVLSWEPQNIKGILFSFIQSSHGSFNTVNKTVKGFLLLLMELHVYYLFYHAHS